MADLLGGRTDRMRKANRADQVTAVELADDRLTLAAPAVQIGEAPFDLLVAHRHAPSLYSGARCGSPASSPRPPSCSSRSGSARAWSPSPTSATTRRRP